MYSNNKINRRIAHTITTLFNQNKKTIKTIIKI